MSSSTKLATAQRSAANLIEFLVRDRQATTAVHSAGLVAFSTSARVVAPLADDLGPIEGALSDLRADGNTNLGAGLELAASQIDRAPAGARRMVVVLSDGATNTGLGREQILSGPAARIAGQGTCLTTIGFGASGLAYDEPFLRRLTNVSNCGGFYTAANASQLENVYLRVSHETAGDILRETQDRIRAGERKLLAPVSVPAQQAVLHATLNWPGSRLGLELRDPSGSLVEPGYPGLTSYTSGRPIHVVVANPRPGTWSVTVAGLEVSGAEEPFTAIFSSRASPVPTPAGAPPELVLGLVLAAALLVAGVVVTAGRPRAPSTRLLLAAIEGPAVGRFTLRHSALIGRSPVAQVHLPDPFVSKVHARLVQGGALWTIEDLRSTSGTFVNGHPVLRAPVRTGDRIRLGQSELVVLGIVEAPEGMPAPKPAAGRGPGRLQPG
ncbi:MAG: FHA domain-containing protein [Chloroflexi bacterium]|nr:FHA domain-containing protein [Chloroflexota bacterium]